MLKKKFRHNNKIPVKKVRKFPDIRNKIFIIINSFTLCLVFLYSYKVNIVFNLINIFVIL